MLLIFDCDGVLVDSEVVALSELSAIMAEHGHPMDIAACGEAFLGRQSDDIARAIAAIVGRPLPEQAAQMRARMLARLEREVAAVPGTTEVLARLDGPRCVASSSDPERIRKTLRWAGLDGYFGDDIFSGLEVAHGKPAPDLFLHAAARMGFAPADCTVVEDSVAGVAAGVAAGMRVIGFTGGLHTDPGHAARLAAAGAGEIIADMRALPEALARA
jgi:HAD superfamily hydrolase (TIGR01509 family)